MSTRLHLRKLLPLCGLLLWNGLSGARPAAADPPAISLAPRRAVDKGRQAALPPETPVQAVIVKFQEGTRVRLRAGRLTTLPRGPREIQRLADLGLSERRLDADLATVAELAAFHRQVAGLGRLFVVGEDALAASRASGEARAGRELADLDLYYRLSLSPLTRAADVADLVRALNALASVEVAYAEPPPLPANADIPPETPDFSSSQKYLDPAPVGIDARYAWTVPGGRGDGIRIVDTEGAWRTTHEDLPPLFHQGGTQTQAPGGWLDHGTAVLGIMVAPDNGYGVTGIVNQAQAGTESFEPAGTATAIYKAGLAAGNGGVVVIELQSFGPSTPDSPCDCSGSCCDCIPVEYFPAEYDAITLGTANGAIVVEAGGNGGTNLDDPVYGGAFDRAQRDSGAILVGAVSGLGFDRLPVCFTNYGSRIDANGWGYSICTLAYGDFYSPLGDYDQFYTQAFGGTSGATPIVGGAVAALLGVARAAGQPPLTPSAARELLHSTGTPQDPDPRQVGTMPNLRAAITSLLDSFTPAPAAEFFTLTPCRAIDTRDPAGPFGGPVLAANGKRSFSLAGRCGVPAEAVAVSANVTIVGPTGTGHLRLYSADLFAVDTSAINFTAGKVRANNVILSLAADGLGTIESLPSLASGGTVHLILDVNGYFAPPAAGPPAAGVRE